MSLGYYGVTFPSFWTGKTGRELRERGGKDAQILGLYLHSNRFANMLGLYRLVIHDVQYETGIGFRGLVRAFAAVADTGYAVYDLESAYVWVQQMVRFRLGLHRGEILQAQDNRTLHASRLYHAIDPNPFLGAFFDAHAALLRLKKRRDGVGLVVPLADVHHGSPLLRGLEAPCKPVNRSGSGSDQITGTSASAAAAAVAKPDKNADADKNRGVIGRLAFEIVKAKGFSDSDSDAYVDLKEALKEACALRRITYNATVAGAALESAIARRRKAAES